MTVLAFVFLSLVKGTQPMCRKANSSLAEGRTASPPAAAEHECFCFLEGVEKAPAGT
jgi:hypothetical protein